jgi:hypothetical protein
LENIRLDCQTFHSMFPQFLSLLPSCLHMTSRSKSQGLIHNVQNIVNMKQVLLLWLYSPLLGRGSFFSFLILHTAGRTTWSGDQPVARPLPTHRTKQTQNKRTQYRHPYLEWDSNPRFQLSSERSSSCLRPRGHSDRLETAFPHRYLRFLKQLINAEVSRSVIYRDKLMCTLLSGRKWNVGYQPQMRSEQFSWYSY